MIKNKYVNNSISNRLLITNMIFACAMLFVIILDYTFMYNREELNTKNLNVFRQNNIYENLNNEIDRLKSLCIELGNDSRAYSFNNVSIHDRNKFIIDMKNKIDVISKSFPYSVEFFVKIQGNGNIIGKDGIIDNDIFYKIIDRKSDYSHTSYGDIKADTDIWGEEQEDIKIFSEYILYNLEVNSKCRVIARIEKNSLNKVIFDSKDGKFESVILKGDEILLSTFEVNDKDKQRLLTMKTVDKEKKYKIGDGKFFVSISESNIYDMRTVNLVAVHNLGSTSVVTWHYIIILLLFLSVNILYCMSNLKIYRPIKNIFEKYNNIGGEVELIDRLLTQVSENVTKKEGEKNKLSQILQKNNFYNLCYNEGRDVDWSIMRELTSGFDCMIMLYIVFEDDYGLKHCSSSEKFYDILLEDYEILVINRTFDKADVYIVSIEKYEEFCEKLKTVLEELYKKSNDNVFIAGGLSETFDDIYKAVDAFKQCEYAIRKQPIKLMDGKTISLFRECGYSKKDKKGVIDVISQTDLVNSLKKKEYDGIHKCFDKYSNLIRDMSFGEGKEICEYLDKFLRYAVSGQENELGVEKEININSIYNVYAILGFIRHKFLLISQNYSDEEKECLCNEIMEFIDGHYADDLSLDIIADKFNITSSYLSTYFKKNAEMNISKYIMIVRLKKAAEMLVNNKKNTIGQISEMVGIPNVNTFNRLFKKYYNETPGMYRRKMEKD